MLLLSILTKKKTSPKTASLTSVPTATETLLLFHGAAPVNECMADERLHAKMQWRKDCRIVVAFQVVSWAGIALANSIGLCSLQTAHSLYFLYEEKMALL